MVFPEKGYFTFLVGKDAPVVFSFPTKKPRKIWLDVDSTTSFRFKINNDETGMLIHMNSTSQKRFKIPSTVHSISISTLVEKSFNMTILVEEWGN